LADHGTQGSEPLEEIPPKIRQQIEANNRLMQQLDAQATPAIFYKDAQGEVRRILGLPEAELLSSEIFQKLPR
jgi:thiol:disulfide interchange protein DsbG